MHDERNEEDGQLSKPLTHRILYDFSHNIYAYAGTDTAQEDGRKYPDKVTEPPTDTAADAHAEEYHYSAHMTYPLM